MNYRHFILVLGTFIIGTDDFVIAGLLPSIANDMGVTIAAAGQLVTAFAIAYAIGALVLRTLMFNMPAKTLLVLSMFVFTPLAMAASKGLVADTMRGKALSFVIAGITTA